MEKMLIVVRTQTEGTHCYPDAPDEVAFLRNLHRHIFHIEAEIEVFHDERELEFFMVKRVIDDHLYNPLRAPSSSCEQIARNLKKFLQVKYPLPSNIRFRKYRTINIKVFEDNENGVYLKEE